VHSHYCCVCSLLLLWLSWGFEGGGNKDTQGSSYQASAFIVAIVPNILFSALSVQNAEM
jgi:hypothetical protein